VDTESALVRLENVAISLHCWQGDDVGGFENPGGDLTGGIAAIHQGIKEEAGREENSRS